MLHTRIRACALVVALSVAMVLPGNQGHAAQPNQGYAAQPLSLDEAVTIALGANDPTVTRFEERARALDDRAVSDSQLPDPKLNLGLLNFPTNSFRYTQEPMTRVQVGVKQAFPRGKTLSLTRKRREAEARAERAKLALQKRQIALDTRTAWLELYYWLGARGTVGESRQAVSQLIEVAISIFATGHQTSQDVLRAELELSLLDDQVVDVERRIEMARANLSRLVGEDAQRPLAAPREGRGTGARGFALAMPAPAEILRQRLSLHPSIGVEDARIRARDHDIDIARQQYKPGWSANVGYGARGGDRADFASVGIALDIPLFTGKRQDRRLAAAKRQRQVARLDRDARLLKLNEMLERGYADWSRLGERVELYEKAVVLRATNTTEAALGAYRAGVSDFAELIRSRLAELNVNLKLLRLTVDRGQAQARLLYLDGEDNE
ncbi:MAG: TolC family protein [Proteobacteria bacterium]|nr:TolC family protein [Pseudomonadota bacterium]